MRPTTIPPIPSRLPDVAAPVEVMRYLDGLWANRRAYAEARIDRKVIRALVDGAAADKSIQKSRVSLHDARALTELRVQRDWNTAGASTIVMNPHMVRELLACPTDFDALPVSVFDRLPYPNPLLIFPEAVPLPLGSGEQGSAFAAYVGGLNFTPDQPEDSAGFPVSTHSPERNGLSVVLLCKINGSAHPDDVDFSTVSVASPRFKTLGSGIASVASRYGSNVASIGADPHADRIAHITAAMHLTTLCLTYISATNSDVKETHRAPKRRPVPGNPTGKANPPNWMEAGYVYGPAIEAARRDSYAEIPGGIGGSKRPHIRRMHPHLYWTGPGRTIPQVKLLLPIPVNGGHAGVPTLHRTAAPTVSAAA